MLVRGQFATYVFALHAPVHSSAAVPQAPHHQPPNHWISSTRCLRLLELCLVQPRLWPQSQWNLQLWSLQRLLRSLLLLPQGLPQGLQQTHLFWQALFVHAKPIFSARQVTKNAKKSVLDSNSHQ